MPTAGVEHENVGALAVVLFGVPAVGLLLWAAVRAAYLLLQARRARP